MKINKSSPLTPSPGQRKALPRTILHPPPHRHGPLYVVVFWACYAEGRRCWQGTSEPKFIPNRLDNWLLREYIVASLSSSSNPNPISFILSLCSKYVIYSEQIGSPGKTACNTHGKERPIHCKLKAGIVVKVVKNAPDVCLHVMKHCFDMFPHCAAKGNNI